MYEVRASKYIEESAKGAKYEARGKREARRPW